MLSNYTQTPDLEFDPCWMDDDQNYSDTLASPTTPILDIDSMYTDWMASPSPKWQETPFIDPCQSSPFDENLRFPVADALWNQFEGDFAVDYQVMGAGFSESSVMGGQSKTEVNGFNLNWPPRKPSFCPKETNGIPYEEINAAEECPELTEESIASPAITTFPKPRTTRKRSKQDSASKREPRPSNKRAKHSSSSSSGSDTPTSPKPRNTSSTNPPSSSDLRSNHNLIEKQYRTRLNLQFESLLEVLPKGLPDEKRVGKAEVLTHANKYIQELRESLKVSEERNEGLKESVRELEMRWVGGRDLEGESVG